MSYRRGLVEQDWPVTRRTIPLGRYDMSVYEEQSNTLVKFDFRLPRPAIPVMYVYFVREVQYVSLRGTFQYPVNLNFFLPVPSEAWYASLIGTLQCPKICTYFSVARNSNWLLIKCFTAHQVEFVNVVREARYASLLGTFRCPNLVGTLQLALFP